MGPGSDVPPAFRRHRSFIGMTDEQVIAAASNALRMVQALPVGSASRAAQWEAFDAAMGELAGRMTVHALRKVREYRAEGRPLPGSL